MTGTASAWLLTLAIEVPLVALVYPGQRLRLAAACAVATSVTNLGMNWLLPAWLGAGATWLLAGELGALVVEAAVYAAVARPRDLARAFLASGLANGASFAVGLVVFPLR